MNLLSMMTPNIYSNHHFIFTKIMTTDAINILKKELVTKIQDTECKDEYDLFKLFAECRDEVKTYFVTSNYIQHSNITLRPDKHTDISLQPSTSSDCVHDV